MTSEEVRLLDISAGAVVATWQCPEGLSVAKVASTGSTNLLVATGQGHLYLLESSLSGLLCTASTELKVDIACIDIAHWGESGAHPLKQTCVHNRLHSSLGELVSKPSQTTVLQSSTTVLSENRSKVRGRMIILLQRLYNRIGEAEWEFADTCWCCRGCEACSCGDVDTQAAGAVVAIHEGNCRGVFWLSGPPTKHAVHGSGRPQCAAHGNG